ncbi:MAG: zinc ribbon domain-containing protein [Candidatus Heimdallarchaeaceae archaeon]
MEDKVIGYNGNSLSAEWWYWTEKIIEHQSILKKTNDKHTSKKLNKLYRKRKLKFRHAVKTIVSSFVHICWLDGVSEIVIGDLTGIRNNTSKGKKINALIHNFWSHNYLVKRIKEKAEEYNTNVKEVNEAHTSSICPRCRSTHILKRKRLFKCLDCGLGAHRDAVGSVDIGLAHGEHFLAGVINRAVACPLLLSLV